jgi:hypothetical protein
MLTSRLQEVSQPQKLAENRLWSFQGSKIEGLGFVVNEETAVEWISQEESCREVVFPYLDGDDLNNSPSGSARRWVINFHVWPLEEARLYGKPYNHVVKFVKPQRDRHKEKRCRERWWQYKRPTADLYAAIASYENVIALARVSSTLMPLLVSARQVFHEKVIVFVSGDFAFLSWLSSSLHFWWAEEYKTTHGAAGDTQYSNARCFETLPRPDFDVAMKNLGGKLHVIRDGIMYERQLGLTPIYGKFHDSTCSDRDIAGLREIHRDIDVAVVRAYGWTDLLSAGLDHGFHDTHQGTRYTIGPAVRQKILERLLELNHARYADEVKAGLHNKKKTSRKRPAEDPEGGALFDI